MIPDKIKESLLFPHSQLNNQQRPQLNLISNTSDKIQNVLHASNDFSEFDGNVFDDSPFCNADDKQSITIDNEISRSEN